MIASPFMRYAVVTPANENAHGPMCNCWQCEHGFRSAAKTLAQSSKFNLTRKPERCPPSVKGCAGGPSTPLLSRTTGAFSTLFHASINEPKGQHDHVRHTS